jgi:hypothetical protein
MGLRQCCEDSRGADCVSAGWRVVSYYWTGAARTDTHSGSVKSDICPSHVNEGVKHQLKSE